MTHSYVTVTDQFCGAGGSSIGATAAGAELKLALNHWKLAIETHNTNFPDAMHDCTDISACDPHRYPSTDILITSPECVNHSLAKGKSRKSQGQPDLFGAVKLDPAAERSRATMWDVPRFAEHHRYQVIVVENVVEARHWVLWDAWLHAMQLLGYDWEIVYLNSMFAHPTPQSRDRMYVVFWRKGNPRPDLSITPTAWCPRCERDVAAVQSWKNPQRRWGKYRQQYVYRCPDCQGQVEPYYYCAANAIDWSLPAPRIGDRERPLKERTLARIRVGLEKFGRQPIQVNLTQQEGLVKAMTDPAFTQVASEKFALVTPFLASTNYFRPDVPVTAACPTQTTSDQYGLCVPPFLVGNYSPGWTKPVTDPTGTVTATDHHALVVPPFMVDLRGQNAPKAMQDALSTVCATGNHHGLVVPPFLVNYYGTGDASRLNDPAPTIPTRDRHALCVPPFLVSYYTRVSGIQAAVSGVEEPTPTVPGWAVHYLAQPGETPTVEECGFRMLQPHEIHRAMAFPADYQVLGNQREKVKQYGNAVTPPVMSILMGRCIATLRQTAAVA